MNYPHLNDAPIVEGLIDIQVKPSPDVAIKDLARVSEYLRDKYGEVKSQHTVQADFEITKGKQPSQSVSATLTGYRLERNDQPFVVLLRRNGLTVSRLKPYAKWNNLSSEARLIWEQYVRICHPEAITRVATRYINRIELPIDNLDFEDYLSAPPKIPSDLGELLSEFLVRLVVPDIPSGASIALLQTLEGINKDKGRASVLIDIDVYKSVELDISSNELWELLGAFRDLKNRTFFGSITSKTLDLFK